MQDGPPNDQAVPDRRDHRRDHRRAWDAIPWVVAGAASAEDTHIVQAHLAECTECSDEWALQQRVHCGLHASVPQALRDPQEAWQKLLARLDSAAPEERGRNVETLSPRAGATPWVRWLTAAVVVQAIGLGAAGLALWERGHDSWRTADAARAVTAGTRNEPGGALENSPGTDSSADYRTLSQPPDTAPAASLRLVPAPGMDFAVLRDLLAQTRMQVVHISPDGGSLGLAAVDGDARTAVAALPVLRASRGVMLAEPVLAAR